MLVNEVMAKNVVTLDRKKTIFDACNMYKDHKVGCLIVTDEGKCAGIVTERDLIERTICSRRDPEKTKISEIMTTNLKTVHALDKIEKAIELIKTYKIKKLPVVKDEGIVGIVTVTDISVARPDLTKRFIDSWVKTRWKD